MRLVIAVILCLVLAACDNSVEEAPASCIATAQPDPTRPEHGMVWVPGGEAVVGSVDFFPEERPIRTVEVSGFWISQHEVTNGEFVRFVEATGYATVAERETGQAPGGAVFVAGDKGRDLSDIRNWWRLDEAANWRRPHGAGSNIERRDAWPVVQIAYEDALAYARWRGHELPSEEEWEFAARGGLSGEAYVWGKEARPGGVYMANHWQGPFPIRDSGEDGHSGLAPVGCYLPNGYGLYDMAGNVWEWTSTRWEKDGFRVIKGGSFLCSDRYCHRYRPAARQPGDETFATEHLGFRTVWRGPAPTVP
jgi:sulfatase modifying factor 1